MSNAYLGGIPQVGANVDDEQLAMCKSLEGTTMPDGSKHDWQADLPAGTLCSTRCWGCAG